jgi:phage tail-like protein
MTQARLVARQPDWLVGQLPVGMLEDNFFYRFASIFQEEAGTFLDAADNLDKVVDPALAPPAMVRFLAAWLALPPIDPTLDETYQRKLVMQAAKLRWWRGTKRGLSGLLELLTGSRVEIDDSGGVSRQCSSRPRCPKVRVRVGTTGWLSEEEFVELVKDEVPANVGLELFVGERRLWPPAERAGEQLGAS